MNLEGINAATTVVTVIYSFILHNLQKFHFSKKNLLESYKCAGVCMSARREYISCTRLWCKTIHTKSTLASLCIYLTAFRYFW